MKAFWFAVIALVVIVVFSQFFAAKKKAAVKADEEKYSAKSLLTENEKKWFSAFKEGVPHAHVFAQVALNQLVKAEGPKWRSAKNKIDPRSIDFVLLSPDLSVLMAIEIDDKSHKLEKRQADDEKKNKALRDAGITLMRFPALPVLSGEQIKQAVVATLAAKRQSADSAKAT